MRQVRWKLWFLAAGVAAPISVLFTFCLGVVSTLLPIVGGFVFLTGGWFLWVMDLIAWRNGRPAHVEVAFSLVGDFFVTWLIVTWFIHRTLLIRRSRTVDLSRGTAQ